MNNNDPGAAPTGGILFTVRYLADESRLGITVDNDGNALIAGPVYMDRATTGEFAAWIADAVIRYTDGVNGIEDPHDIAMSYRDAIERLDDALDTRLTELQEEAEQQ